MDARERIKDKKRIVIKIGTSTLTYPETGNINLGKLEKFVRILINIRNKGKEVIVVTSGAVGVGKTVLSLETVPREESLRQACAAVGQGRLMMIYEKLFSEYSQMTAQVLLTKESILEPECRQSAKNTFEALLNMNVIPIVNENDAISIDESKYGNFGDNDNLSAYVVDLVGGDLLILLSDIEGLYTDDPKKNPDARFVHTVYHIDSKLENMGKGIGSELATGGMATKIAAAKHATKAGADMVIANGKSIYTINDIMSGKKVGTLFLANGEDDVRSNEVSPKPEPYKRRR